MDFTQAENTSHPSNNVSTARKGELSGINASAVDVPMLETTKQVNSALSGENGTSPRSLEIEDSRRPLDVISGTGQNVATESTPDAPSGVSVDRREYKPLCHQTPCNDPSCRLDHLQVCEYCNREIDEAELVLTGRFGDRPLHEDCARALYGE